MSFIQDLRGGLRLLGKNPAFTLAAIACLALGIGATTAIFSVVNAVILRPLEYRAPSQLVRIYSEFPTFPNGGLRRFWISPAEFVDIHRSATNRWQSVGAWTTGGTNLTGAQAPIRITTTAVTGDLLNLLGVQPMSGRLITPKDDMKGAPQVAVISYGLWQRAFGGDPSAVGRDIHLDAQPATIVGIMPKGFEFPPGEVDAPDLWTPLQIDPANLGGRSNHFLYLLGRLRPEVTPQQGLDELRSLVNHWSAARSPHTHAFDPANHPLVAYGFQDEVVRTVRPAMLMLLGAVGFVLLISCVNVANLLLARAEGRQREMAIRKALGAGLKRLASQLAVEGVLLSFLGAVLGIVLAYAGLQLIKTSSAASIPRVAGAGIDLTVLAFTLVVSVVTGVVFGLTPLLSLAAQNVHEALKASANRATATDRTNNFRSSLVVAELSLALVLLIGSGLMVRAFWKLQEVNPGFKAEGILTMQTSLPNNTYKDAKTSLPFWNSLIERCSRIPGVDAAVFLGLPPLRPINANDTYIEGFVKVPGGPIENVDYYQAVSDGYFRLMGIPLIDGRFFNDRDGQDSPKVVVVNQTMARTFWPHESALGHRVRTGHDTPWLTIVGIAADVKNAGLDKPTGTELYFPLRQTADLGGINDGYLALKSTGDPSRLASIGREEIHSLDASLPVSKVRSMEDVVAAAQSRPRFIAMLLTIFSTVALTLAAIGIYGVISYSVAQRTGEFGIRMALGADAKSVFGMVLGQGLRMGVIGVLVGCAGALALARFVGGLLFGVSSFDLLTFLSMAAALLVVTLIACYIPARRATKVDPIVALREE